MELLIKILDNKRFIILLANVLALMAMITACQPTPTQTDLLAPGISVSITSELCPNIEVQVGQQVSWTNRDTHEHTVREKPDEGVPQFDSGTLQPGDTYRIIFMEPGNFTYECSRDASIIGTIVVIP